MFKLRLGWIQPKLFTSLATQKPLALLTRGRNLHEHAWQKTIVRTSPKHHPNTLR